jgi:hypothetical protein
VEFDTWKAAQRLLREYGDKAEAECDARADFHKMEGDEATAEQWRKLKGDVATLRMHSN